MADRDILIVGGGITGLAIAYQLGKLGLGPRVRLVERHTLAAAATSRAAALVTLVRSKTHFIPLVWETYRAIDELQSEFGQDVGLRRVGALHVGTAAVAEELRVQAEAASGFGIASVPLGPAGAATLAPWLDPEALGAAMFYPQEAFVEPYLLATAYGRAAVAQGVEVRQGVAVSALRLENGCVAGVHLQADGSRLDHDGAALGAASGEGAGPGVGENNGECKGETTCEPKGETDGDIVPAAITILAGGAWSGLLTAPLGHPLPMAPVRSQYWITETNDLFPRESPIVLLPEAAAYARPEVGGLLFGVREEASAVADPRRLPADLAGFCFDPADPEGWDNLAAGAPALRPFFPALDRLGIAHYITGPSNYTPDGNLIVGAFPDLPGLLVATGCNGAGIATSGGVGRLVAERVAGRQPFVDATPFRPERFGQGDCFAPAFLARCAASRSGKRCG